MKARHYKQAVESFESGDFDGAYPLLKKLARSKDADGVVYAYLAACEHRVSGANHAYVDSLELARQDPKNVDLAYQVEGVILCDEGQIEKGIELLRQAVLLKADFQNLLCLASRIELLGTEEARGEARSGYQRVLDLEPENEEALFRLGNLLAAERHTQEAIALLLKALEVAPERADTHFNLGLCYEDAGQFRSATFHFRKAIEHGYESLVDAQYSLGSVLHALSEKSEAIHCFRRCLEMDPSFEPARERLAAM